LACGADKDCSYAHKIGAGTGVLGIGTANNDVGTVTSPKGRQIAIAVFVVGSKATLEARERVISHIAAAVVKAIE
jgi:beta-lactamase class A